MWAWGKPRIASLLYAFIRQVQILEDTIADVGERYTIAGADDARLAILGKIVGQSRLGAWSTETYRAVIRGRIRAAHSHGRHDDIVEVLRLATRVTERIRLDYIPHAKVYVTMPRFIDADMLEAVRFLLPKARAAGVQLQLLVSGSTDPDDTFLWGDVWATNEEWAGAIVL
jgi:hypothetical protein